MKILIDMNLSPAWVEEFTKHGWTAQHWSAVGKPDAPDSVILEHAAIGGWLIFTHDLDFGTLLATRNFNTPSVIQLRGQEITPAAMGAIVVSVLRDFSAELLQGALITIDSSKTRARILPLR